MTAWEVLSAVLLLSGGTLSLLAAIGLLRFPDVLSRLQAATKPQVFGLLLVLAGVTPVIESDAHSLQLVLVGLFQLATAPVIAQLIAREAYRRGQIGSDVLVVDELARDLADGQGRQHSEAPE